jgi:WD40 repeat protein
LTCLSWNPESEDIFTAGASDGTLVTIKYSLNSRASFSIVGQIKMQPYPTCLSWSPKGKQLTVGDASGRLHQLKPELTNVKVIEAPSIPNISKILL